MKLNQVLTQSMTEKIEVTDGDTTITIAELKLFIQDSVNEAMTNHVCRIKANDDVIKEIPDVMNAIKHIGGGDISKGAALIQDNHRVMTSLRRRSDAIAVKISNFIMLIIVGGLVSAVWLGIKQCIKME